MANKELEEQFAKMPQYLQPSSLILDTYINMEKLMRLFYEYIEKKKMEFDANS